tara:strand:+ start:1007 stop:1225 length:219 start_codon:yes stop_codon:yes gene_type:complete
MTALATAALATATAISLQMATIERTGKALWSVTPRYSVPKTRFASAEIAYRVGSLDSALLQYEAYCQEIQHR